MILDEIGYQGTLILNIIVAIQLWGQWVFFVAFIVGFWLNKWLNECLKSVFREPRPIPVDLQTAKYRDPLWWIWDNGDSRNHISPVHRWGMPSGHAQSASFAIAFFYFLKEKKIRLFETFDLLTLGFSGMLALFFITLCQRWITQSHSLSQLVMGSIIGALFAGVIVFGAKWIIVENTKKPIKNI